MRGTRIGDYTLVSELGAGGMGTVWRAQGDDGRIVAVKVVHPHLVEQPGFRERFEREARSGLAVASPCVVRTIACLEAESDGRRVPALVLEYVDGRDLGVLLPEAGSVPEDLCRHLAREIARGLAAVHAAGIVHRDLKPGNVLLTASGEVKVMDLGLARQASGEDRMSQTGLFLGTAAYAPPEQFFGRKDLDPRSDLYSLGAMLFELATGRVPFEAEGIGDLVRKVLRDRAPRIGTLAPQTTPFFEEFVATLLEKDPDRRFASADDLVEVLTAGESGDWWAAAAVRLRMETRRPLRRVRVARETALWGREDDLAELRSLWDRVRAGRGAVALVEGEAGIGKTRLVEEFLDEIESAGDAQIVAAKHDPAGSGAAADAMGAAFRDHIGPEDLDARLLELLADTPDLVPGFAALLRGDPPPQGAAPLHPAAVRTLFAALARALAAEAPLVLLVDDLHFASDEGRALFAAVAHAVAASPVLVVGTTRPVLSAAWTEQLTRRDHVTRHTVQRLDEAGLRQALTTHLGSTWEAESVAERVAAQADGNPYFVVEALRHLGESGHLARTADGAWRVTTVPAQITLPHTVRELVAARLAALVPADRELLEAAACQGHTFDGRLVGESLGWPRMDVLRALGRLEHATRLVRAAGVRFAFDHHVVHEVLYGAQDADARRRRHAAIGTALEARSGAPAQPPAAIDEGACASIAEHLFLGDEPRRAAAYLDRGLAHHERRFRNGDALRLADLALAAPGLVQGAERAALLLRIMDGPLDRLGLRARAADAAREAEGLADAVGDLELLARSVATGAWALLMTGRADEAEERFRRVLSIAERSGSTRARAAAENGLGNSFYLRNRFEEAVRHYSASLEIHLATGDVRGQAGSTINIGNVLLATERVDEARDHQMRGLALARQCGFRPFEANALSNLAITEANARRYAESRRYHEMHAALLREMGDRVGEATSTLNLASLLDSMLRPVESRACYEKCIAISRDVGDRVTEAYAAYNLGNSLYVRSEDAEAEQQLARALVPAREAAQWANVAQCLFLLGDLRWRAGDLPEARRLLVEAHEQAIAVGLPNVDALAPCRLACVARAERERGTGSGAADEVAALVRDGLERLAKRGAEIAPQRRALARLYLWQATGDRAHLEAARPDHDAGVAALPDEVRAESVRRVREFKEVAEVLAAQGV